MTPFYIDFSVYPEAVAEVLYKEIQEHAFELGYKWLGKHTTLVGYALYWNVIIFERIKEELKTGKTFLEMKKEPEYYVGMPMINEDSVCLYLKKEGETPECFTGVALKHSWGTLQYTPCDYYYAPYWKPIDPSRIKVTIN